MLRRNSIVAAAAVLSFGTFNQAQAQFQPGEFISWSQDSWGAAPSPGNAAQLLLSNFDNVYPGGVEVGINGAAGFSMTFSGANYVLDYLPVSGTPGSLNSDLLDPTSTSSGIFGGVVLALQIDVGFSDAGLLAGPSGTRFGDLNLVNMSNVDIGGFILHTPAFDGLTVRQFLSQMNTQLGGGAYTYDFDDVSFITSLVGLAFENGQPTQFAQDHLRIAGDFNGDGKVNAADYVKWRKDNGSVTEYTEWRSHFGNPAGAGTGGSVGDSVPEPAILLSLAAAVCLIGMRRRK